MATHKKYQMPEDQMYFPVQVGAEGKTKIEEYTQDNTGNNISLKNMKEKKQDIIGIDNILENFEKIK